MQARSTFGYFHANWQAMSGARNIKVAFPTSTGSFESIWLAPSQFNGDQVTAQCLNQPVSLDLKMGDVIEFSRNKIVDWMILNGNDCYGGYSIRVQGQRQPGSVPNHNFLDPPSEFITR